METVLDRYSRLVQSRFQEYSVGSADSTPQLLLSATEVLRRSVKQLEKTEEFAELVRATAAEYKGGAIDDETLDASRSLFDDDAQHHYVSTLGLPFPCWVHNYFRFSGLYQRIFARESVASSEVCGNFRAAFARKSHTITYLAALNFVDFTGESIAFGEFQLRRFSRQEIDDIPSEPGQTGLLPLFIP